MDEPRNQPATPRKLARARRQGVVAYSADVTASAVLLALAACVPWAGPRMLRALRGLFAAASAAAAAPAPAQPSMAAIAGPALDLAASAGAALLALALAAALAGFVQVGPLWAGAAIAPDLRRLAPGQRLRAWFSAERWIELALSAFKLLVLAAVAAITCIRGTRALATMPASNAPHALALVCRLITDLLLRVGVAALLLGAVDLVYRHLQRLRALRMGRRELLAEQRDSYGQPEQRKARQRAWAEAQAHAAGLALEQASVLLLDARGHAVALGYDGDDPEGRAPHVVAKAAPELASRLRLRADQCGVPVRMAPALVNVLLRLEIGERIPRAYHAQAAELLWDVLAPTDTLPARDRQLAP